MPPPWGSFVPAVLCLGLYTSVRVAEQVRAGIQSLPRGQRMAGRALGLRVGGPLASAPGLRAVGEDELDGERLHGDLEVGGFVVALANMGASMAGEVVN